MIETQPNDDRAVSEVVAFILVFSIIIGSVGLLYMTGFSAMEEFQEGEQLRNAERAMVSLSDNLNDVQRSAGVRERSGEMTLRDGALSTGEGETNITISGGAVDNDNDLDNFVGENGLDDKDLGSLTYGLEQSTIAYEGGAVFRNEPGGTVPIAEPHMVCEEDDMAVVSVLIIEPSEQTTQRTDGVEVTAVEQHYNSTTSSGLTGNIEIDIQGEYEDAWERTLTQNGWTRDSGGATCRNIDRAIITVTTVEIEF